MGWNEQQGKVSTAFSEWGLIDRDQRTFLRLGLRFAQEKYDEIWDRAAAEPGDPDGPELVDVFNGRVDGLWPHDYEWMHLSGVLKDSVTSFEVYLEKASDEVLRSHGLTRGESPWWRTLKHFFSTFDVSLDAPDIRYVRDLRHFLTHQRGELRTEAQREKFTVNSPDALPPIAVELSEESVTHAMDKLALAVRAIDPVVWTYTFGGERVPDLKAALSD